MLDIEFYMCYLTQYGRYNRPFYCLFDHMKGDIYGIKGFVFKNAAS